MKRFDQHAPIVSLSVQREICRLVAMGKTLKQVTRVDGIPTKAQIYGLMWRDPAFKRMYKDARLARAEVWAEEMREEAAKAKNLKGIPEKKAMAHVQACRLVVDTDKWLLSKILADEYGDELPDQRRGKAVGDFLEVIRGVNKLARDDPQPKTVKATVVIPTLHEKTQGQ